MRRNRTALTAPVISFLEDLFEMLHRLRLRELDNSDAIKRTCDRIEGLVLREQAQLPLSPERGLVRVAIDLSRRAAEDARFATVARQVAEAAIDGCRAYSEAHLLWRWKLNDQVEKQGRILHYYGLDSTRAQPVPGGIIDTVEDPRKQPAPRF